MATTIKLKNSVVKDKVPLPSNLEIGEVAVGAHVDSPALFFKDNADNILTITPGSSVESVNGQTGVVVLAPADVGAATAAQGTKADSALQPGDAATTAQGTKADSAVQPGDDVSDLTNDAGYITLAEVPASSVLSVNTQTGDVSLGISDLTDVDTTTAGHIPAEGEFLVWDQLMNHWMPGTLNITALPALP